VQNAVYMSTDEVFDSVRPLVGIEGPRRSTCRRGVAKLSQQVMPGAGPDAFGQPGGV